MVMTVENRFWSKVDILENCAACWLWTAALTPGGYGRFAFGKRGSNTNAQRIAWMLTNGEIPPGMDVLHRCDNPPCVNPAHLFLGTQADNVADMDAKGRRKWGGFVPPPRSGVPWIAKVTESEVTEIRALFAGGTRQVAIAKSYGISQQLVSAICRRHVWKHVS
jgi:hypothetical protein